MNNLFLSSSKKHFLIIIFFLSLLAYKIYFENFVPLVGDELNAILVYSSNIKSLFLKNFPNNVTFFHLIGLVKTYIVGFEITSYRLLTYFFFLATFIIFFKFKNTSYLYLILILCILSNFLIYLGIYIGYIFSSFIFINIFYLLSLKSFDGKISKIIFFLLFIQTYSHLVNIYLVIPILLSIYLYENNKKNYLKNFITYFFFPLILFYFFSIILTGIYESRFLLNSFQIGEILHYSKQNFLKILNLGFNRIFFYEAYKDADTFSVFKLLRNLLEYDKYFFVLFLSVFVVCITNLRNKLKKIKMFSLIFILHFFTFFIVNKDPAPRIFTGFFLSYVFYLYLFFSEFCKKKINKNLEILLIVASFVLLFNLNFLDRITKSDFGLDMVKNDFKKEIILNKCRIKNNQFTEMEKKTYYFQYLNLCKKDFNLFEFRNFYKS